MSIFKGMGDFFALDVGTNAIRIVQLSQKGQGYSLVSYGYTPVDSKIIASDSAESQKKLGEVIMTAVGQSGTREQNVVIGLPSSKTFSTVIDVPKTSESSLNSMMKYQIDQYIPTAVDETKVDWALMGQSPKGPEQQEVLLASTSKEYSEARMDFIESLGFNVIAIEPDPIALVRSLVPQGANGGYVLIDMGERSTDIVVVLAGMPRLIRTLPTGIYSMIKAVAQNLNVQEDQARQFLMKFGLAEDKLDGHVVQAVGTTLDSFGAEITKSINFFNNKYPATTLDSIVVSGFAGVVPLLPDYIARKVGMQAVVGNPWADISIAQDQANQLSTVAHEFATVIGLAKRSAK